MTAKPKRMSAAETVSARDEAKALEMGFTLEDRSNANCLRFYLEYLNDNNKRAVSSNSRRRLVAAGLIQRIRLGSKTIYDLTARGEELLGRTGSRRPRT